MGKVKEKKFPSYTLHSVIVEVPHLSNNITLKQSNGKTDTRKYFLHASLYCIHDLLNITPNIEHNSIGKNESQFILKFENEEGVKIFDSIFNLMADIGFRINSKYCQHVPTEENYIDAINFRRKQGQDSSYNKTEYNKTEKKSFDVQVWVNFKETPLDKVLLAACDKKNFSFSWWEKLGCFLVSAPLAPLFWEKALELSGCSPFFKNYDENTVCSVWEGVVYGLSSAGINVLLGVALAVKSLAVLKGPESLKKKSLYLLLSALANTPYFFSALSGQKKTFLKILIALFGYGSSVLQYLIGVVEFFDISGNIKDNIKYWLEQFRSCGRGSDFKYQRVPNDIDPKFMEAVEKTSSDHPVLDINNIARLEELLQDGILVYKKENNQIVVNIRNPIDNKIIHIEEIELNKIEEKDSGKTVQCIKIDRDNLTTLSENETEVSTASETKNILSFISNKTKYIYTAKLLPVSEKDRKYIREFRNEAIDYFIGKLKDIKQYFVEIKEEKHFNWSPKINPQAEKVLSRLIQNSEKGYPIRSSIRDVAELIVITEKRKKEHLSKQTKKRVCFKLLGSFFSNISFFALMTLGSLGYFVSSSYSVFKDWGLLFVPMLLAGVFIGAPASISMLMLNFLYASVCGWGLVSMFDAFIAKDTANINPAVRAIPKMGVLIQFFILMAMAALSFPTAVALNEEVKEYLPEFMKEIFQVFTISAYAGSPLFNGFASFQLVLEETINKTARREENDSAKKICRFVRIMENLIENISYLPDEEKDELIEMITFIDCFNDQIKEEQQVQAHTQDRNQDQAKGQDQAQDEKDNQHSDGKNKTFSIIEISETEQLHSTTPERINKPYGEVCLGKTVEELSNFRCRQEKIQHIPVHTLTNPGRTSSKPSQKKQWSPALFEKIPECYLPEQLGQGFSPQGSAEELRLLSNVN